MSSQKNNMDTIEQKLELIKLEIEMLDSRLNTLVSNLWKVRQIGLTLWLAALGVGLGVLSQAGIKLTNVLILSSLIPILFLFIDAKITRWSFIYHSRSNEIQKFFNQALYILPSNRIKLSFINSTNQSLSDFPAYDLKGQATFGENEYHKYNTSLFRSILAETPLTFYSFQFLGSLIFITIDINTQYPSFYWWGGIICFVIVFATMVLFKNIKMKELEKKEIEIVKAIVKKYEENQ